MLPQPRTSPSALSSIGSSGPGPGSSVVGPNAPAPAPVSAPAPAPYSSSPPVSTIFCPMCSTFLSYPVGARYIQCPSCHSTLDPSHGAVYPSAPTQHINQYSPMISAPPQSQSHSHSSVQLPRPSASSASLPLPLGPSNTNSLAHSQLHSLSSSLSSGPVSVGYPSSQPQIRCPGCSTFLLYPPDSSWVQCPNCSRAIDVRTALANMQQRTFNAIQPQSQSRVSMSLPASAGLNPAHRSASLSSPAAASLGPIESIAAKTVKSKKRKDPHAPKAVRNAYMIFCQQQRDSLKTSNPDLSFGKLGGKLGEMWRCMNKEEKTPYENLAAQDRERYRNEMLKWQHTGGFEHHETSSKRAAEKNKEQEDESEEDDSESQRESSSDQYSESPANKRVKQTESESRHVSTELSAASQPSNQTLTAQNGSNAGQSSSSGGGVDEALPATIVAPSPSVQLDPQPSISPLPSSVGTSGLPATPNVQSD